MVSTKKKQMFMLLSVKSDWILGILKHFCGSMIAVLITNQPFFKMPPTENFSVELSTLLTVNVF